MRLLIDATTFLGVCTGQVGFWYRKVPREGGGEAWQPRVVHPYLYATNDELVVRFLEFDFGKMRTCDNNQEWDFDMQSATFRKRVEQLSKRVLTEDLAAFKPDARTRVQQWRSEHDFRHEGPFTTRWVRMNTFDLGWDLTAADETVGDVTYHNRPF